MISFKFLNKLLHSNQSNGLYKNYIILDDENETQAFIKENLTELNMLISNVKEKFKIQFNEDDVLDYIQVGFQHDDSIYIEKSESEKFINRIKKELHDFEWIDKLIHSLGNPDEKCNEKDALINFLDFLKDSPQLKETLLFPMENDVDFIEEFLALIKGELRFSEEQEVALNHRSHSLLLYFCGDYLKSDLSQIVSEKILQGFDEKFNVDRD